MRRQIAQHRADYTREKMLFGGDGMEEDGGDHAGEVTLCESQVVDPGYGRNELVARSGGALQTGEDVKCFYFQRGRWIMNRRLFLIPSATMLTSLALSDARAQNIGKQVISSSDAPEAIGPYSQAIRSGSTVYVSGQIAIDPKTKQLLANASIEDQTRLVLENLKAVLAADGLTLDSIVSATVFLTDLADFAKMNEVYATYFKKSPPARATVEVAHLPRSAKVEISAIAVHP